MQQTTIRHPLREVLARFTAPLSSGAIARAGAVPMLRWPATGRRRPTPARPPPARAGSPATPTRPTAPVAGPEAGPVGGQWEHRDCRLMVCGLGRQRAASQMALTKRSEEGKKEEEIQKITHKKWIAHLLTRPQEKEQPQVEWQMGRRTYPAHEPDVVDGWCWIVGDGCHHSRIRVL